MHSNHPANLLLRLILEITGLISVAQWGWQQSTGVLRYLLAIAVPLLLAVIWVAFDARDPENPTRNRIYIPGGARLTLELACFGFVVWSMLSTGKTFLGVVFIFAVLLHYIWSMDRVIWLLRHE